MVDPLRLAATWEDKHVEPGVELVIGCVLLVISGWWWFAMHGAIWHGWHNIGATIALVLGPVLVHRGWTRRRTTYLPWPPRTDEARFMEMEASLKTSTPFRSITCVTCMESAELVGMPDRKLGFLGYSVLCPRCGVYLLEREDPAETLKNG